MSLALADLLAEHWDGFRFRNRKHLCSAHYRAVRAVRRCRTEELGGMLYQCESCHRRHYAYHSCNHRSCPQCGAYDQQVWTAKKEAKLLPVPYFMVTFTIPSELRSICQMYPKELYTVLLKQSAQALKDIIATKHKQAEIGFTSILHTWGRQLQHHPHVHCIVPALAILGNELVRPARDKFLIHYKPLAVRFRSLFQTALREQHPEIYKALSSDQKRSLSPATTWNVQLQHVGKGKTALRYLATYVCRSGFTARRLIGYDKTGKNVLLKYTPSGTKQPKILKLSIDEFIRRWLIHVLPKGFLRIRHYGYLSSAAKAKRLKLWSQLGQLEPLPILPEKEPFCCPHCEGPLRYLKDLPRPQSTRGP